MSRKTGDQSYGNSNSQGTPARPEGVNQQQTGNESNRIQISQLMFATQLTNLMVEFALNVFVDKPENLVEYAANYFDELKRTNHNINNNNNNNNNNMDSNQPIGQLSFDGNPPCSSSKRPSNDSQRSHQTSGSLASINSTNTNQEQYNNLIQQHQQQNQQNQYQATTDDENSENNNGGGGSSSGGSSCNQQNVQMKFNRRKSVFAEHYDPANDPEEDDVIHVVHGKTDEQRQRLAKSIRSIFIFRSVDSQDVANILDAMFEVKVSAGDIVIRQGDDGDNFYVVERGKFQIYVTLEDGTRQIRGQYENNGSFGELALMYNQPRAASVVALTDGSLWAMDRNTFRRIVLKSAFRKRKEYEALFEKVSILQYLNGYERMNLCDALESKRFANGQEIIQQGDQANGMYFIESGNVKIVKRLDDGSYKEVAILGKGDYFGELALIKDKPRAASVYAIGDDVKLAFLDVKAFERLLGSCIERMEKNCAMYLNEVAQAEAKQKV